MDSGGDAASAPVVMIVAGTRPECIKLAPVIRALVARGRLRAIVVNSGQHQVAVRDTFASFGIVCDVELDPPPALPNLRASYTRLRDRLHAVIDAAAPDRVLVQGDTLTAYAGARAGHDANCPVVHVEAGLRTDSVFDPFPEEWFRRRIARHASIHFAPSDSAVGHLHREGIDPATVHRVGNTGIDCLRALVSEWESPSATHPRPAPLILVTLHRRENWGLNADVICDALIEIHARRPDLRLVFPVHPNPRVAPRIRRRLGGRIGFDLVAPMAYRDFVRTAASAALVISDSGGVQEEIPHLGTPLLVPRTNTERPESLATGFVRLVAADRELLVAQALELIAAPRRAPLPFDHHAPYGAGDAGLRIAEILEFDCFATRRSAVTAEASVP